MVDVEDTKFVGCVVTHHLYNMHGHNQAFFKNGALKCTLQGL